MRKSFNTRSKESTGLLFTDDEVFNKEFPAGTTLADIKDVMQIKGNIYIKDKYANTLGYKMVDSDYYFTVKFLF